MYKQSNYSRYSRGSNSRSGGRGSNQGRAKIRSFDPSQVIGRVTRSTLDVYEVKNNFSDFKLEERLLRNITAHGFKTPTPIQDQAIPKVVEGHDVVGMANTGTGKTAAFLIPLINKIYLNKYSRVLIITPTRELAVQIDKEFQSFSQGMGLYSVTCIGGVPIRAQITRLQKRPHFVVGTPGRLLDLHNRRKINFSSFDSIVLDEVDRMLDMGFIHDINEIVSKIPHRRQSLFFAATLNDKVREVMGKFINNPVVISVKTADASENVHQDIIKIGGRSKSDVLCDLLNQEEVSKTLVFTRTKRGADVLQKNLAQFGYQTAVLHGNKSQSQRQRSLDKFGQGGVNILIATDVASRGIDVDDITHVINYDLPESYDAYIHRIGRTGRADKKGIALTFVA